MRSVLSPALNRLSPGDRVLLVVPTSLPSAPAWLGLSGRDGRLWTRALMHDRSVIEIGHSATKGTGSVVLPVRATCSWCAERRPVRAT